MKKFLEAGQIVATHALSGEVRAKSWGNSEDFLCDFDEFFLEKGAKKLQIESSRPHKNVVIMKFAGVDTLDAANSLLREILYIDRDEITLADGENFVQDILGIEVFHHKAGKCYGKIVEILQTGANDVYRVVDELGRERLVPAISEVVQHVDVAEKRMEIEPLSGLFEDEN